MYSSAGVVVSRFVLDPLHPFLGTLHGQLGAFEIDVLGALAEVGEDVDAIWKHLAPARETRQAPPSRVSAVEISPTPKAAISGVCPGPHSEIALGAWRYQLVHVLAQQKSLPA